MVLLPRRKVFLVCLLTWILRQYQHKNPSEKKWFYEVHSKEPTFSEITELRFKFNVSSIFFFIYLRERDADINPRFPRPINFFVVLLVFKFSGRISHISHSDRALWQYRRLSVLPWSSMTNSIQINDKNSTVRVFRYKVHFPTCSIKR